MSDHKIGVHEIDTRDTSAHEIDEHNTNAPEIVTHNTSVHEIDIHEIDTCDTSAHTICANDMSAYSVRDWHTRCIHIVRVHTRLTPTTLTHTIRVFTRFARTIWVCTRLTPMRYEFTRNWHALQRYEYTRDCSRVLRIANMTKIHTYTLTYLHECTHWHLIRECRRDDHKFLLASWATDTAVSKSQHSVTFSETITVVFFYVLTHECLHRQMWPQCMWLWDRLSDYRWSVAKLNILTIRIRHRSSPHSLRESQHLSRVLWCGVYTYLSSIFGDSLEHL